jgi:prepilin-type N-terminal cleavage/methylation domain-containing protein
MILSALHRQEKCQALQKQKGFTLMELLIAMTLFLVIITLLGGALRLAFRTIGVGEQRINILERYRSSYGILTTQLQSALPFTYEEDGARRFYLKGNDKNLEFATSQAIWGADRGWVISSYQLEANDEGKLSLYASERSIGIEGIQKIKLYDDLSSFAFSYFGKESSADEGKWVDEWQDNTRYPELIRVNLTRDAGEERLLIPLYARAKK